MVLVLKSLGVLCRKHEYLGRRVPGLLGESADFCPYVRLEKTHPEPRLTWWWPSRSAQKSSFVELTTDEQDRYVTLPRVDDWRLLKKERSRLKQRGRDLGQTALSPAETMTTVHDAGLRIMTFRRTDSFSGGIGALDDFIRLFKEQRDEVILAYAQRWGVLKICSHFKPYTHQLGCWPLGWQASGMRQGWELISTWREYSSRAYLMLRNAAELFTHSPTSQGGRAKKGRQWSALIASLDSEWLRISGVGLNLCDQGDARASWPRDIKVGFNGGELFGLLCVQLLMAVTRADELSLCASCGNPFIKARRRRKGESYYCPTCRANGSAERAAARLWWQRNKAIGKNRS